MSQPPNPTPSGHQTGEGETSHPPHDPPPPPTTDPGSSPHPQHDTSTSIVVQAVQLTTQVSRLQPELLALMRTLEAIEKDFAEKDEELNKEQRRLENEQKEHEERLQEWKAREEDQLGEQYRKLQLDTRAFMTHMDYERQALKKEEEDLKEMQDRGNDIIHRQEPVTLEVGGEKFRTELSTLSKCRESIFPSLVKALERKEKSESYRPDRPKKDPYIFIDRDGKHFRFILNYLRQGKQVMQGTALRNVDKYVLQEMLIEVRYYKLTDLERLLELKLVMCCEKPISFNQLITTSFKPLSNPERFKYITTKDIDLGKRNLIGIIFEGVIFEHSISFRGSVLVNATFCHCWFREAVDLTNADITNAKFDQCEGLELSTRFTLRCAITEGVKFNPPLDSDDN